MKNKTIDPSHLRRVLLRIALRTWHMKILFLYLNFSIIFVCRAYTQDTLNLEKYAGNLKKVKVTIGSDQYYFLFDTGGGETFISSEIAKSLGKIVYGSTTGFRMSGETIRFRKCDSVSFNIGPTKIFHSSIGVWDIMSVLPEDFPKLDGVLSFKSFHDKILTLDLGNNRIISETPHSYQKAIKNKTLLKSRFANGVDGNELTVFLGLPNSGHLYWFLFDSGNLDDLSLSHNTAYEWGLENDSVTQRKQFGSLAINLGLKKIISEASSNAIIYDGSLNFAVLSKLTFIIDFPKKQVWMY
jgi:hypothetical protein